MIASSPTALHNFVLGKALGGSGGGTVYEAQQKGANQFVAVKVFRLLPNLQPEVLERFLGELRRVAQLRHPHVVTIHGMGRTEGGDYFQIMELIRGTNLAALIAHQPLAFEAAVGLLATVADALEYCHQRGVVHRDLKPGNVLVDGGGQVKLIDFSPLIGTPQYMAPEQADRRFGPVGPHTDVYGLGALLYTVLVRRQPFPGDKPLEVLRHVLSQEMPLPPSAWRPETPEVLDEICLRCLSKDIAQRWATAGEVAAALRTARFTR